MTTNPIKLILGGFNNLMIAAPEPAATRQAKRHEAAIARRNLKQYRSTYDR